MKKTILFLSIALAVLSSCTKTGVDFFRGAYGYSISGTLTCFDEEGETVDIQLVKEMGSMHIEPNGETAILTMDAIGGDVLVFEAEIEGNTIELNPVNRNLNLEVKTSTLSRMVNVPVVMRGTGTKTNGLLVLSFKYSVQPFTVDFLEEGETVSKTYMVIGSNVNCIANYRD